MRRSFLWVSTLLLLSPSLAFAKDIWRCQSGDDVRFEQKTLAGYACTRPSLSPSLATQRPPSPNLASRTPPSAGSFQTPAPLEKPVVLSALPAPMPPPFIAPRPPSGGKGVIYKRMVNGVAEFSSRPVDGGKVVAHYVLPCYACRMGKNVSFASLPLNATDYAASITSLSKQYTVDPAWVRAIVHAESNFNPLARSPKGAQGLMQLMPATARRFGVSSPFDPEQNLAGGVQYLSWLLKRFNGDLALATAAYNAGEGAVDRYKGVPPFSETQTYVQRVSTLRSRYASL